MATGKGFRSLPQQFDSSLYGGWNESLVVHAQRGTSSNLIHPFMGVETWSSLEATKATLQQFDSSLYGGWNQGNAIRVMEPRASNLIHPFMGVETLSLTPDPFLLCSQQFDSSLYGGWNINKLRRLNQQFDSSLYGGWNFLSCRLTVLQSDQQFDSFPL